MRHPQSLCRNKIIFCTRLWNNKDELNQMRIDLARQLKKSFRSDAVVGISDNLLSRQMCPDLILPGNVYARKNFISLVNDSSICIATTGLFRSIGWRFGEFVSAGKAILSEPLYYEVPGEFEAGRNYETFDSINEALNKCDDLLSHPEKIHAMELANQEYYLENLKPDVLVMNTLKQALQLNG